MKYDVCSMSSVHLAQVLELERLAGLPDWDQASLEQSLNHPDYFQLVVLVESLVVGCIRARKVLDEVEIYAIVVHQKYRRKRIGQLLFNELVVRGFQSEIVKVLLEVRRSNQSALAFYHSFGFDQVGIRKSYYRNPVEDACILEYRVK